MIHSKFNVVYEDSNDAKVEAEFLLHRSDFQKQGNVYRSGNEIMVAEEGWVCYGYTDDKVNHSCLFGRTCFVVRLTHGDVDVGSVISSLCGLGVDVIVTTEYGIDLPIPVKMDMNHSYQIIESNENQEVFLG